MAEGRGCAWRQAEVRASFQGEAGGLPESEREVGRKHLEEEG